MVRSDRPTAAAISSKVDPCSRSAIASCPAASNCDISQCSSSAAATTSAGEGFAIGQLPKPVGRIGWAVFLALERALGSAMALSLATQLVQGHRGQQPPQIARLFGRRPSPSPARRTKKLRYVDCIMFVGIDLLAQLGREPAAHQCQQSAGITSENRIGGRSVALLIADEQFSRIFLHSPARSLARLPNAGRRTKNVISRVRSLAQICIYQ